MIEFIVTIQHYKNFNVSVEKLEDVLTQFITAVMFIHKKGNLHNDIKHYFVEYQKEQDDGNFRKADAGSLPRNFGSKRSGTFRRLG